MSSSFSWADRVNIAVGNCLPCLHRASSTDSFTNHRPNSSSASEATGPGVAPDDDLRRLLVDSDSDALSLHSNIGNSTDALTRRKAAVKKANSVTGRGWGITLFGYHLFGRPPQPAVHLPTSSDDDDVLFDTSHSHHTTTSRRDRPRRSSVSAPGEITRTTTLHSTATFDSDAAPLDERTINSLSDTTAAALALAEEEERRAKEERRKRRRERREMKKMARALAAEASVGDEFEGFQGSGGITQWPAIPQAFMHETQGEGTEETESRAEEDRAPSPTELLPHLAKEEEDEGADLDGMTYARRRRPPPSGSQRGGSDSRSRTSSTSTSLTKPTSSTPKRNRSSKKSKSSHRTKSTLSSNDSTSLASPTSPGFDILPHEPANTSIAAIISPTTVEQGQGFFDYHDDVKMTMPIPAYTQPLDKENRVAEAFPSTGLGVRAGAGARGGAFLANTNTVTGHEDGGDDSFDGTF